VRTLSEPAIRIAPSTSESAVENAKGQQDSNLVADQPAARSLSQHLVGSIPTTPTIFRVESIGLSQSDSDSDSDNWF
jgi:hypothetical protein